MKLADLNPEFYNGGGEGVFQRTDRLCPRCNGDNSAACEPCHGSGREYEPAPLRVGLGIIFDCPCGNTDEGHPCAIPFANPLDGREPYDKRGWHRTGDTPETLSLRPSIQRIGWCNWHGFITNGEVETC